METKNVKTEVTKKVCTVCKSEKPLSEFGKLAAAKDGHLCFCKECNRARNKNYRLRVIDVSGKLVAATVGVDWDNVPVRTHEVRVNNDCVVGDYFKNLNVTEDFVLEVKVWDKDENDVRQEVSNHRLYVKASEWKKTLDFPQAEQMKADVETVTDAKWGDFVFRYTKAFGTALPNNLVGLRFKKHGSSGKCVNVGFNLKNLPALEAKFSK